MIGFACQSMLQQLHNIIDESQTVMLKNILGYTGLVLIWLISKLPMYVIKSLGSGIGIIGYHLVISRRNVGLKNLSLCFPEMGEKEKHEIIKEHFKRLVTAVLEYGLVFYANKERLQKIVKIKNAHYMWQYYENQPIIILCPHFVGLDLAAIRLSLDFTGYTMYSQQKNSLITDKLSNARLRFINDKGAKVFARRNALRPIIKLMRENKLPFYYLPDQDFGEKDSVFVPFFAYPTCATVTALPKLVQLTNAVVIPLLVHRIGNGYEVEFYPPWENYPSGNITDDVKYMNSCIEGMVLRAMPEYFWLHKRFKTQPDMPRGAIYK
jgi:Kdo2-lipid IVA lauroyltransferase/acyltransferase